VETGVDDEGREEDELVVLLRQDSQFGNIRIKKTSDFEQAMNTKVSSDQWT
jgi:hypothetical protein